MSAGDLTKFQASMSKTKGNPKDAETLQSYLVEKAAGSNWKKKECVLSKVPLDVLYKFCLQRLEYWYYTIFEDGL